MCWYNDANVFFNKVTWSVLVYQRLGINTLQLFEVRLGKSIEIKFNIRNN